MHHQAQISHDQVQGLVDQVLTSRKLTRSDQHQLMKLLLSKSALSREDEIQINRVFECLQTGLLRIVD